ncbi:MAG: tRNA pseudouridine(55) synthase TruB [Clostridia bacterium]|nr:tRNA pseudouridine(55) synthase TruB [Clostridia bacterium]
MNGIIVIDKPPQKTSHDMVYFVRKLTGIKKVGHTGTLDPDATGVLPICIGRATKAADMLTVSDKEYETELVLGKTTDTQDASGKILTEQTVNVTEEEVLDAVAQFIGEITQIPPMFSAIKKDGKKLYELARQGITVERTPRKVTIYGIGVTKTDLENNTVNLTVSCSKGTYIRTLCEDIGKKLGVGAYMNTLRRTKSAGFDLEQSYTVDELIKLKEENMLKKAVLPLDSIFSEYDKIKLPGILAKKVKNGVKIGYKDAENGKNYRIYDENGAFLCISECKNGELVLKKAFWS